MVNFAARCKASVPEWMHKAFGRAETPEEAYTLSVAIACEQCDALIGEGVEHLHVYTLNNPDLTFDVCRTLGYVAAPLASRRRAAGRREPPSRSSRRVGGSEGERGLVGRGEADAFELEHPQPWRRRRRGRRSRRACRRRPARGGRG